MKPPKALLLSIIAQGLLLPVAETWPPTPSARAAAAGVVLLAAGVLLNVWSERLFRASNVGVCPFSPVASLVNRGPYRISRNPMYLGIVLISVGVALETGLLWNLWISAALGLYLHYRFVLPEEEFLIERLGSQYLRYAFRTPRWFGA